MSTQDTGSSTTTFLRWSLRWTCKSCGAEHTHNGNVGDAQGWVAFATKHPLHGDDVTWGHLCPRCAARVTDAVATQPTAATTAPAQPTQARVATRPATKRAPAKPAVTRRRAKA